MGKAGETRHAPQDCGLCKPLGGFPAEPAQVPFDGESLPRLWRRMTAAAVIREGGCARFSRCVCVRWRRAGTVSTSTVHVLAAAGSELLAATMHCESVGGAPRHDPYCFIGFLHCRVYLVADSSLPTMQVGWGTIPKTKALGFCQCGVWQRVEPSTKKKGKVSMVNGLIAS